MSVRQGLLALLGDGPRYGYQLRQEFEARTGGTWPLNIGQVYTTLGRLQRDGLVVEADRREDGSVLYAPTEAGRTAIARWWVTPVDRGTPSRDELAIKLALAVTAEGVDVATVVQRQRTESMRALQEYTRLKARIPAPPDRGDLAWLLVLDNLIFTTEAEIRWLDHTEQRVAAIPAAARRPHREGSADGGGATASPDGTAPHDGDAPHEGDAERDPDPHPDRDAERLAGRGVRR